MPNEPKKKPRHSKGRKPTIKQIRAAKLVVENHGNISKSMKEAGYSESSAKNPKNLTESKCWADLMEEFLPESKIAAVHSELLEAERPVVIGPLMHFVADNDARARAVDMGYKLRGKFAADRIEITRRKYQDLSNAELMELMKKLKANVTKK